MLYIVEEYNKYRDTTIYNNKCGLNTVVTKSELEISYYILVLNPRNS